jgi:hypothetical protein
MSALTAKASSVTIDLDEDQDTKLEAVVDVDNPVALDSARDPDVIDEDAGQLDQLPDDAVKNADGSVSLALNFPVTLRTKKNGEVKERVYRELTFHRLTGADMRMISSAKSEDQNAVTFARSTRMYQVIMNALFDKMDLTDIERAGRVLVFFVSSGRKTGG